MIKNYLKTGFRNLIRHKRYALINIIGLAAGIASCLLITLFIKDEFTFDRYHRQADSIFKIITDSGNSDGTIFMGSTFLEAEAYSEEIPGIRNFARLKGARGKIALDGVYQDLKKMVYADAALYELFDFQLKSGAFDDRLKGLESIVITESTALKHFGKVDAVGERLQINLKGDFEDFVVTAVIEDHPSNSSFDFDMALSWEKLRSNVNEGSMYWFLTNITSFLQLEEGIDTDWLVGQMKAVRDAKNPGEEAQEFARQMRSLLVPLKDVHFDASYNRYANGMKPAGEVRQSYILSAIGLVILVIACFNFANLSIVNSVKRSKEVGVRKTIGALRKQLTVQFLSEAFILTTVAFVLGIILAEVAIPVFEQLTEKKFTRNLFDDPGLMLGAFLGVTTASLISIVYPALILSRLKVTQVFKGSSIVSGKRWIARSMVTIQFLLALVFITVAVAIGNQHQFLVDFDKGYDDENLIRLSIPHENSEIVARQFKAALAADPNVLSVGAINNFDEAITLKKPNESTLIMFQGTADHDYLSTLGIEVIAGKPFSDLDRKRGQSYDQPMDVWINAGSAQELALTEPVGQLLQNGRFRIAGVFEDYQLFSAKSKMNNIMLTMSNWEGSAFVTNNIYIRYRESFLAELMTRLEGLWVELLPFEPFNYRFEDVHNAQLYAEELRLSQTLQYAASLAIIVSVMGLLGLVGLSASQRKKEVSIRKVLGASITGLILLLNRGFTKLLFLAILMSVPVAYYIVNRFLEDYINRMPITPRLFILPTLFTFAIAWLIVSSITLRSARRNPVEDLHYE